MNRPAQPMRRSPWGQKRRASEYAEAAFQARVEELAGFLGWYTWHLHQATRSPAGFPDLLMIRERVIWVELKATSRLTGRVGKVTPTQTAFHDRLRAAGQEVHVWWDDSSDWAQIKEVLSRGGKVTAI